MLRHEDAVALDPKALAGTRAAVEETTPLAAH